MSWPCNRGDARSDTTTCGCCCSMVVSLLLHPKDLYMTGSIFWFWRFMLGYYKGETKPSNPINLQCVELQNHYFNLKAPKNLNFFVPTSKTNSKLKNNVKNPTTDSTIGTTYNTPWTFHHSCDSALMLNHQINIYFGAQCAAKFRCFNKTKAVEWNIFPLNNNKHKSSLLQYFTNSITKNLILNFS